MLTSAIYYDWIIQQLGISNAFLLVYLEEWVFMEQYRDFEDINYLDQVCKLRKSFYDLKQAHRAWFMCFSHYFLELGFTSSSVNTFLFYLSQHSFQIYILIYVDDILVVTNSFGFVAGLLSELKCEFALKDLGALSYFLGIQEQCTISGLHHHQEKYLLDLLNHTKMLGAKPTPTPCTSGSKLYRHNGDPLSDPKEYCGSSSML